MPASLRLPLGSPEGDLGGWQGFRHLDPSQRREIHEELATQIGHVETQPFWCRKRKRSGMRAFWLWALPSRFHGDFPTNDDGRALATWLQKGKGPLGSKIRGSVATGGT
jgi:hypothetical protein